MGAVSIILTGDIAEFEEAEAPLRQMQRNGRSGQESTTTDSGGKGGKAQNTGDET